MFLASGLNAAPAAHVTFASCGSLLIQYSKSSVSLAFAWVSHSQGIPFWVYILALICNLLSLDLFLSAPFPWDCTWLPMSCRSVTQGSDFSTCLPQACVVFSLPLLIQELDIGSSLESFVVWILIIIRVSFDVNTINLYNYYLYSKAIFAPCWLTHSSRDTLINFVVEIITKCNEITFYS